MIQYLRRGIPIAWLVDPEEKNVTVYHPGQEVQVLEVSEELIGDTVLPDLRIPVASLFTLPTPPAAP
jgi:Uma2 family endonuclease